LAHYHVPVVTGPMADVLENPWGYGKRFRFTCAAIEAAFPEKSLAAIRVLDVGCGNGSFLAIPLARRGFSVTAIDLDPVSIEHGSRLAADARNARFILGHVNDLTERDFDVAILSEVLEHVSDPSSLLVETVKRLQPRGIVIITVPNGRGEFEIDSWIHRTLHLESLFSVIRKLKTAKRNRQDVQKQWDASSTDNHNCGHVHFFTRRRLQRLFAQCSLEVVQEAGGPFICGPIACYAFARFPRFIKWNVRVTDQLPLALASSWYFVLSRINPSTPSCAE